MMSSHRSPVPAGRSQLKSGHLEESFCSLTLALDRSFPDSLSRRDDNAIKDLQEEHSSEI